jgi:predicted transcriptional regulator
VVDIMIASPALTTRLVATRLNITVQGATNLLRQLEEVGAVRPRAAAQGVQGTWTAEEVLRILDS